MERVGRVSKNAAALVGAKLVTSGLSFLLAIIINKELGPVKVGIYNYAFVLYTIFQVIPDMGIGNITIRDVSQDNTKLHYYYRNVVGLRILLGLGAFILLLITNVLTTAFQQPSALTWEKFWVVFTIAFCLLIEQPFSNTLAENFIALERLTVVALVYLVIGIMKVGLSIYVVLAGFSNVLVLLILVYILTYLYSIAHFYVIYRRLLGREGYLAQGAWEASAAKAVPIARETTGESVYDAMAEAITHTPELPAEPAYETLVADYSYADLKKAEEAKMATAHDRESHVSVEVDSSPAQAEEDARAKTIGQKFNMEFWRYLVRSAWPLAVVSAAITIYAVLDIPILSWIKGDKEVGLYSAAAMFAKAFVFLTIAINMAVLPAVSKVAGKYPEKLGELWERMLYYALVLVAPLVVLTPILARPFLILEGHDFIVALPAVWLTMAAMVFTFLTAITFPFFIAIDKQKIITKVVIAGLAIKTIMDLAAIFIWGYMGAAVVVIISEFIVFAILCSAFSREIKYKLNIMSFAGIPFLSLSVLYPVSILLQRFLVVGKDTLSGSIFVAVIASAILLAIYLAIAFTTGMFSKDKLNRLNQLLKVE